MRGGFLTVIEGIKRCYHNIYSAVFYAEIAREDRLRWLEAVEVAAGKLKTSIDKDILDQVYCEAHFNILRVVNKKNLMPCGYKRKVVHYGCC